MQDAVIVIDRTGFLIVSAIAAAGILLPVLQFWFTLRPARGMKIGLALAASLLVGTTAWSFATLL